ncbi:MAG: hypothetical protein JNM57_06845 [Cyclobacteriaceae bacterium]|nr:hypothetical protein [Cyclobacteriaceae bacterium]
MKTTILLSALSLTVSSFTVIPDFSGSTSTPSSQEMAKKMLAAFQHSSQQEYTSLFPSLTEFHQFMVQQANIYGEFLNDAKRDFAADYQKKTLPALAEAFDRIADEGKKKGIDWNSIQFVQVEHEDIRDQQFSMAGFSIVFKSNEKEYRLVLEKALVMNGQWKVTQFIRLM